METRELGSTGLRVSILGFGAMQLGDDLVSDATAGRLLNEALDLGINLIDTARSYGQSEDRIGRHLSHRRREFVLSTKLGYGAEGHADWTYGCITAGVEAALKRLRTDYLDLVHLHSCPLPILQRGEVTAALAAAQAEGKVRIAAYSGDNAELDYAIRDGRFGSVQTSISVCDQASIPGRLPEMVGRGLGILAKRPVAGSVWHRAARPASHAEGEYWDRWRRMALDAEGLDLNDIALRFSAFLPGVASCIVGTRLLANLRKNLESVGKGPLPETQSASLRAAFDRHGADWAGLI